MAQQNEAEPVSTDALDEEPDVRAREEDSPVAAIDSEKEDAASTTSHYEIVSIPADFTLEGLVAKWNKKQLKIPGFQRKFIWTQRQASRLIESFLLGLPVPALFLYADPDTGELQVIDGQQRLMSVFQFFEGTFKNANMASAKMFRLVGLAEDSPYSKLNVTELEEQFPGKHANLNDAVMRAFMIKQLDPEDATSIYHIFERLNTGGSILLGQEIRNCVYHGPLNDLLNELNTDENWRKIIGKPHPDARMRDVEMILRFVALYFCANEYKKPMKDFLSMAMRKKRNLPEAEAQSLKKMFQMTCQQVIDKLGKNPFHRNGGRMNPAVFDAVFTTIAKNDGTLPPDLRARCDRLMNSAEFDVNASFRTTDVDAVRRRLELARTHLLDPQ
ncbi:hypothetical protein LCGC14_1536310 [marine sediment metagenome]|uniref:GmrSD restriction endonucleases N-terminal domain-containing protein n=1 Tax=marine sediment metagenome TaxID=412755 RepID=A0A0F9JFA6_9ZZZZ